MRSERVYEMNERRSLVSSIAHLYLLDVDEYTVGRQAWILIQFVI
jgi:hypothetical protein